MKLVDGLVMDGLTDVYNKVHMGVCAEKCAKDYNISREEQDDFAIESYKKSEIAWDNGKFSNEIVPIEIHNRKKEIENITDDEEYKNINIEKVSQLRPVFDKEGTVTAANASTLNDGASALVLMSMEKAKKLNIKPIAKVVSYSDAAHEPENFTTAPAKAIENLLKKNNLSVNDIDCFELNEAFSVVGLANIKILNLDKNKVNINGGAVSLGHPLGNSGSRIIVTLINVLNQNKSKIGVAGICNGGGGASAMLIEAL
jgi:acetyl-CoA C-acetyltransferase